MSARPQPANPAAGAELALEIERVFDAPCSLVYMMWTDPVHGSKWAPDGMEIIHNEADLRVGGRLRIGMRAPDGSEHWEGGVYCEIVPNKRLVFTHAWEDGKGGHSPETLVQVEFEDAGPNKTRMIFRQTGFGSAASRDGHDQGWTQAFDKLAAYVEVLHHKGIS
jgi:uncharacterized protein YndB with AHSA1/START domain